MGGMVDVCANQTLDAMACHLHFVAYKLEDGYTLEAIDLETFEQYTVHADELMTAVVKLGEQIGVEWADI